jgi:hypothetical protein
MARPILTLKKKPTEPMVQEPPGSPVVRNRKQTRAAISFLAGLGLPLFERMEREDTVLLMAVGIREEVLARIDPGGRRRVRKALSAIVNSHRYQKALKAEGARRRTLDDADAGPAFNPKGEL